VPEGHTVHRLAAHHRALFAGSRVRAASPQGRFAAGAKQLTGRVLRDTEAVGKHLLLHFDGGRTLHVHLGLYGKFADGQMPAPPPVGEVRLRLTSGRNFLDLRGPAACELLPPAGVAALRARLGADPLRAAADPDSAYRRISRSRTPLAGLLLDQSVVAGPGLIYVSEVLFRAGLPPTYPGRELSPPAWHELWRDLCALMK
jgi:endonuclease-8